jgi:hypothetical protein
MKIRSKARVELQGLIASLLRCFRAVGFYRLKFKVPSYKFKVKRQRAFNFELVTWDFKL